LIKTVWERSNKKELTKNTIDSKYNKQFIETFEQIFLLTLGRVIKPESGAYMKLK
jgi:hypothetical protein